MALCLLAGPAFAARPMLAQGAPNAPVEPAPGKKARPIGAGPAPAAPTAAAAAAAATAPTPATAAAAPASAASASEADTDPLERLRRRLAERLAAVKPADAATPYELHVRVPAAPGARAARGGERPRASKPEGHAWGYEGAAGPEHWGGLCASGQRQSPIDIRGGLAVDLEPIRFDYRPGAFSVVDNGHTVQVNVAPGNGIEVAGRRYELQQFHFHRPSEERLDGRQFDLSVHFVHKDSEGRLAVVAVLVGRGSAQPALQTVFGHVPLEKNEERQARSLLDPSALLPADRGYYTYMGSLTTPPCSEGVLWVVMRTPTSAGQEQIDTFAAMYPFNARPPQQAAGRRILQTP